MFTFSLLAFWAQRVLEVLNMAHLPCCSWASYLDGQEEEFRMQHKDQSEPVLATTIELSIEHGAAKQPTLQRWLPHDAQDSHPVRRTADQR